MASKEKTVSLISSPPKKPRRKYDQGSQYNSKEFKELLRKNGFRQSMSRKILDNAFAGSFFSRYKAELLQNGVFDHYEQAYFQTFVRTCRTISFTPPPETPD